MKHCFILVLVTGVLAGTYAQKLPNKQEVSVKAPANVKIDGKLTEWGEFKAYNSAIEVNYTIANDNNNLYLVIQATNPLVARKIIAGGVTFSVVITPDGIGKNSVSITYPLYDRKNPPNFNLTNKAAFAATSAKADSFMTASNKELVRNARQIIIKGIKVLNDTLSVYNEEGIMVTAQFDSHLAYNYELALPLKYLNIKTNKGTQLNYNIKFNGSAYAEAAFFEMIEGGMRISSATLRGRDLPAIKDMQIIAAPTDMSGTYTLAQ